MDSQTFHKHILESTVEYRRLLQNELTARWESVHLDLMKSYEYEAIWGLVSRQCSLVNEMSYSYLNWNELFLPIILRCMVENYINISWIIQKPEERAQMYIDYGLGAETKVIEYVKSKPDKTEVDETFIKGAESWVSEQRHIFLNKINIGSWNFSNIRKTAEDAGCKGYYDLLYPACSFASHSTWNYVAKHNLKKCDNPLHKDHRVPVIKEQEIEVNLFLILTKVLQDTFDKVDKKFSISIKEPSSFDYIQNVFNYSEKDNSQTNEGDSNQ